MQRATVIDSADQPNLGVLGGVTYTVLQLALESLKHGNVRLLADAHMTASLHSHYFTDRQK
jgi:hypothetical protein